MAEAGLIKALRVLINEDAEVSEWDDSQLGVFLDEREGKLNVTAAYVWRVKAGRFADLVTMTEGNSSRQWSNAYKQALEMAQVYQDLADGEEPVDPDAGRPTAVSRKITRT